MSNAMETPEDTLVFTAVPEDDRPPAGSFAFNPIGDDLVAEMPGFDILPCGHCGAVFDGAGASVLGADRVLRPLVRLACEAGWGPDVLFVWSCPGCRQRAEDTAVAAEDSPEPPPVYPDIFAAFDRRAGRIVGGAWEPLRYYGEPAAENRAALAALIPSAFTAEASAS